LRTALSSLAYGIQNAIEDEQHFGQHAQALKDE
jgi:hypothetical protein